MGAVLRKWTSEERDQSLLTLAACGGNSERASKVLKEQGITIPPRTLRRWRESLHTERYLELSRVRGREIEEVAVVRMRETMLRAQDVQQEGLEQASVQLRKGEARDPSAVARNAAVVGGINSQHLLTYTGRPNVISEHRSAEDILKSLAQRHPGMFIDGTAEEVPPDPTRLVREVERRKQDAA
jgi:hypothetical protein